MIQLLTGNDLLTGDVLWWSGGNWSRSLADAKVVPADRAEALKAESLATGKICDVNLIDAEETPQGLRPLHIRERVRAIGPSVRLDLSRAAPCTFTGTNAAYHAALHGEDHV